MTAAAADRARRYETLKIIDLTLKSGKKAYKGAEAFLELSSGKVVPATSTSAGAGYMAIGHFLDQVDAASADKPVQVDLETEILIEYFINGTSTDAVAATDVGQMAYALDDQTVSILGSGKTPIGRIWKFSSTKGVGVQRLNGGLYPYPVAPQLSLPDFAAADSAPTAIVNGAIYDVPTTAANSTISLPAAASDGAYCTIVADGTKNGHTLTIRDVTTAITAASTASKRVTAQCFKSGGKWFANLHVGP